jgi:hypothetical protein
MAEDELELELSFHGEEEDAGDDYGEEVDYGEDEEPEERPAVPTRDDGKRVPGDGSRAGAEPSDVDRDSRRSSKRDSRVSARSGRPSVKDSSPASARCETPPQPNPPLTVSDPRSLQKRRCHGRGEERVERIRPRRPWRPWPIPSPPTGRPRLRAAPQHAASAAPRAVAAAWSPSRYGYPPGPSAPAAASSPGNGPRPEPWSGDGRADATWPWHRPASRPPRNGNDARRRGSCSFWFPLYDGGRHDGTRIWHGHAAAAATAAATTHNGRRRRWWWWDYGKEASASARRSRCEHAAARGGGLFYGNGNGPPAPAPATAAAAAGQWRLCRYGDCYASAADTAPAAAAAGAFAADGSNGREVRGNDTSRGGRRRRSWGAAGSGEGSRSRTGGAIAAGRRAASVCPACLPRAGCCTSHPCAGAAAMDP